MIAGLHVGAFVRFETMIAAVIETADHSRGGEAIAVCCVDLGDEDGRRFALALHAAHSTRLDPASFAGERQRPAPQWCRVAPLAPLAVVAAAVLGAEIGAAVEVTHAAGAVPVVIVADGLAMVAAFARPLGAS